MKSLQRYFSPIWPFEELDTLTRRFDEAVCFDSGFPKWEQWLEDEGSKLVVQFLLAGYPKESLSVTASEGKLLIEANKVDGQSKSGFASRAFKRELYDTRGEWAFANASTSHKDGVLRIEVPKKTDSLGKKLLIQ